LSVKTQRRHRVALFVAGGAALTMGCTQTGPPRARTGGETIGAVSSLTPTEADARLSRIEELLRRIPGVQVRQQPDGNYELRIRGQHALSGSAANAEPLLVIDDTAVPRGSLGSVLAGLAPRDVARIDVLKDASATGLYGSRGANGVIVIVTKRAPLTGQRP
jgi:TonB-dependent SusC/RagA subfamily outer membrane receptor